jgi:hypothetical protein
MNVLNVLEPKLRDEVLKDIISKVKPGGVAVIGTRKWKGDISTNKRTTPAGEDKAVWVHKKDGDSYQKGFDGNELKEYVERIAGPGYTVEKSNVAASGVVIRKNKSSRGK